MLLHGQIVDLTRASLNCCASFARHPGEVFASGAAGAGWGYQHEGYEHTVNTYQPPAHQD
ncbi:hypothetical protein KIF59_19450 [Enterobacter cloacae subsp. cloacae]|nr:hypothetical protein [Enterobacter cloacae subsp. cloacae]